ncbi:MAG: hypothetical protein Q4G54_08090 [Pelistega sp.]|nr:hypothetical protein [Pelistega sp.]
MSEKLPITNSDFTTLLDRATRKAEAFVAQVDAAVSMGRAHNKGNSTIIHGRAEWKTCWRYACYLSKYIYKDPPSPEGFQTRFPEQMALVEKHWEKWDELVNQAESGLVARLFKTQGYDPSIKSDGCAPTLVFRGTDFEDMRNLVIVTTISLSCLGLTKSFEFIKRLDNTLDSNSTRQFLLDNGFEPFAILNEPGVVKVPKVSDEIPLIVRVELKLEILAKQNGDWSNNIRQGLGKGSEQYKMALRYTRKVLDEKIMSSKDRRLEVTGHSLGGGLASAVSAILDQENPSVYTHAIVFNPSGVHPNTIKPASPADGLIHVFAVKDDILTTLQNFRSRLPIAGAVFNLARKTINQTGMPEAVGNLIVKEGIRPGRNKEQWAVPAKGEALPTLFPIHHQTLVPWATLARFPELNRLDRMLHNSPSVAEFANLLSSCAVKLRRSRRRYKARTA